MNTLFLYRTTPRIRLKEFNALAEPKVAEAVNELRGKGATSFVLDLRDNPGGLVQAGVEIARLFLPPDVNVAYTEGRVVAGGVKGDTDVDATKIAAWTYIVKDPVRAELGMPNGWVNINATCYNYGGALAALSASDMEDWNKDLLVSSCNTLNLRTDTHIRTCLKLPGSAVNILRQTAPPQDSGLNFACVSSSDTVGLVMLLVVCFSLCVQAAEGLHYGIVPYVSRPALGIVSGMVGAGGNLGSVIALSAFFRGKTTRTDTGFMNLGIMVMAITALMFVIYFPDMGGMLVPAGALGSYDPQIIKPPADYRGADSIDFSAAKKEQESKTADAEVVSNA